MHIFTSDVLQFSEKLQMEVREYHKLKQKSASIEENCESPKRRSSSLLTGVLGGTVGD